MLILVRHCLRLMMLFVENLGDTVFVLCNVLVRFIFYVVYMIRFYVGFILSVSVSSRCDE